jgi:hypothetical protein
MHYFSFPVGPGVNTTKSPSGHIMPNLCFCIQLDLRNEDAVFFMLWWSGFGSHKKRAGTHYAELVFLQPVGSKGHALSFGASGVRNVDTLFSCSGGPVLDPTKSALGHNTPNLCFCIRWDSGHVVHYSAPGA